MKKLLIIFVALITTVGFAQKAKVTKGSFKDLKGITNYNLVFDYSDLSIPKYDSEEEFLKDKMEKREKKEAGAGDKFKASWFADRENRYEPKFVESFNKRFDDGEVKVGLNQENAEYTMKVHTTLMSAGYNIGISRKNAMIDAVISVYKTEAPNDVIMEVVYKRAEGGGAHGYDYDSGYRISECYAKLAKTHAKTILKKAK